MQAGSKGKEEWVTVIFGEDGKQIVSGDGAPPREKSVYDMEDEDFSATKATPFPGKNLYFIVFLFISVGISW